MHKSGSSAISSSKNEITCKLSPNNKSYIQKLVLLQLVNNTSSRRLFKGEVRSWSNLISEERVKFSEQNSENLMKIGWKIRKLWNLEVLQIFRKHFLTSPYEYANEWVDDVIASLLAIYFVHKILKILIFAPTFDSYVPHVKIYWC